MVVCFRQAKVERNGQRRAGEGKELRRSGWREKRVRMLLSFYLKTQCSEMVVLFTCVLPVGTGDESCFSCRCSIRCYGFPNRCIRELFVQWWERRTSSLSCGEAACSIRRFGWLTERKSIKHPSFCIYRYCTQCPYCLVNISIH